MPTLGHLWTGSYYLRFDVNYELCTCMKHVSSNLFGVYFRFVLHMLCELLMHHRKCFLCFLVRLFMNALLNLRPFLVYLEKFRLPGAHKTPCESVVFAILTWEETYSVRLRSGGLSEHATVDWLTEWLIDEPLSCGTRLLCLSHMHVRIPSCRSSQKFTWLVSCITKSTVHSERRAPPEDSIPNSCVRVCARLRCASSPIHGRNHNCYSVLRRHVPDGCTENVDNLKK